MKTLKQLLERTTDKPQPTQYVEPDSVTSYTPKAKDEKRFADKHVVKKTDDVNGNGDDVFNASNVKYGDRAPTRHGYNPGQDQEVYEAKTLAQILEKHLTPAEMKKREEIAKAMERQNPGMDKSKKMAIATAQAKKVAEESDLFAPFAEDIRADVQAVYDLLDEENKQLMIELIEDQEYDTVVVKEALNG
jgi:hypothetical protein